MTGMGRGRRDAGSAIRALGALMIMTAMTPIALAAERAWTRSEILAIADQEAQRVGYNVENLGVSVDFYNSLWTRYIETVKESFKGEVIRQIEARLNGRSGWVVSYRSPLGAAAKTFGLFVFIDRDSGEVIGSFDDSKWQEGLQRPNWDTIPTSSESATK